MVTGPRRWSEEAIAARMRAGYGSGEGKQYKPWIEATDVPGDSKVTRTFSKKFGRTVHLVSDVEHDLFGILEYAPDVIELQEQKPMSREHTLRIAHELNVRHPYYPGTMTPTVMTVDMLVYRKQSDGRITAQAWDCKYGLDEEDERAVVKLQITRQYWAERGVEHLLAFRSTLPEPLTTNIRWVRGGALKKGEVEPYEGALDEHLNIVASRLNWIALSGGPDSNLTLPQFGRRYEDEHGLPAGMGLRLAKTLMYERVLKTDLDVEKPWALPLSEYQCTVRDSSDTGGRA